MKLITLAATVICLCASTAFAKGHDQGRTEVPGADNVGSTTVANAHGLGFALGERPAEKGPSANNPATGNAGR